MAQDDQKDRLVTIVTYWDVMQAHMARNRLNDAGIRATVQGEELVGMAWHLANAVGGVRVLVWEKDAPAAMAILEQHSEEDIADSDWDDDVPEEGPGHSAAEETPKPESDVPDVEPPASWRDRAALRAAICLILGLMFLPLQLYVLWLLVRIWLSNEPISRGKVLLAQMVAIVNLSVLIAYALAVINMLDMELPVAPNPW